MKLRNGKLLALCVSFIVFVQVNTIAVFANYDFEQTYASVLADDIIGLFPSDRAGNTIYPEFWGGMYFDEQGRLVINSTDNEIARYTTRSLNNIENVVFREVENSYNELHNIVNIIRNHIDNEMSSETESLFSSISLDVAQNSVLIGLNNHDIASEELFRAQVIDSDAIIFFQHIEMGHFFFSYGLEEEPNFLNYSLMYMPTWVLVILALMLLILGMRFFLK